MHYVNNTALFSHEETRRQFNGGYSGTAKDSRNYVYVGAVLEREFNEWLTLGAELFGNSPDHASQGFLGHLRLPHGDP